MSPCCLGACQQPVFFGPAKPLDRRLSLEGRRLGLLGLAVGQFHGETATGVSRGSARSVRLQPLGQVVGDARVQRAVRAAEDVNKPA